MAPKNVDEKFAQAKQRLAFEHRFLSPKMFDLKWVKQEGIGTAGTDGVHVWWDPAYIEQCNLSQTMFVIVHEEMHPLRKHHIRALQYKNWNKTLMNIAMDVPINNMILDEMGLEAPPGIVIMPQYKGWAWEDIYRDLEKKMPPPPPGGGGSGDEEGEGEGEGQGQGPGGLKPWDKVYPYPGHDENSNKKGGKAPKPGESDSADPGEIRAEDKKIEGQLKEMERIGRKAGKIPGSFSELVKEMTETKVPWQQVLARFVDENSDKDYDWMLPDENYINGDIYIPSLHDPKLGTVAVIFDTSGSVGSEDFKKFVGGLVGILSSYDTEVFCIDVDYDVHNPRTVSSQELGNIKVDFKGRGGTSFIPGFEYLEKEDIKPKVAIYFTDGECWEYPEVPDYPVLWAILNRGHEFKPPFGEVLVID